MEIIIDGYTVRSTDTNVSIYDENGKRWGHFPTKEPITNEEGLREIYDAWHNGVSVADKYLAAKLNGTSRPSGHKSDSGREF